MPISSGRFGRDGADCSVVEPDQFKDEGAAWDVFAEIWASRGIDLNKAARDWAKKELAKLHDPGAQADFRELCNEGCSPIILACILACMKFSPELPVWWSHIAGAAQQRRKTARVLERTAKTLEDAFQGVIDADMKLPHRLTSKGIVPPKGVVASLRFYSKILNLEETLTSTGETRSGEEVSKYLLVGYVKEATGHYRDRNTATIIGEILGPIGYDDVAQRMWRLRNYARLDGNFSGLANFLFAMGVVIDDRIRNVTDS